MGFGEVPGHVAEYGENDSRTDHGAEHEQGDGAVAGGSFALGGDHADGLGVGVARLRTFTQRLQLEPHVVRGLPAVVGIFGEARFHQAVEGQR